MSMVPSEKRPWWRVSGKLFTLFAIVAVLAVAVGAVALALPNLLNLAPTFGPPCPSSATGSLGQTHFTLLISNQGFNDSRNSVSCPSLTVTREQSVTIHVVNNDVELHGFVITHYLGGGIMVGAGQSADITFVADQSGSFSFYCNVGCGAHHYLLNGRLNVT